MESFTLTEIPSSPSELIFHAHFPNSSPDFLFDAFTQPELLAQWWVPLAQLDPRPGGAFRFRWTQMNWTLFGTLLAFQPGKHLEFTWKWEHAPELPQRTVEVLFDATDDGAELRLIHGRYNDNPRDLQDRENHRTGWHHFLHQLALLKPDGAMVKSEAL